MKKIFTKILVILIIIQPFLNLYVVVNNSALEIAGFHISTLIRYGLLGILGLYIIFKNKVNNHKKILISYGLLVLIYTVFHHINSFNFKTLLPNGISYSFIEEVLYIIRYLVPLFLTYYICSEEIKRSTFEKTLLTYSIIISSIVIVSDLLYISYSSYYDIKITQNIIDWFTTDVSFATASSRGLFHATIVMTPLMLITPYFYSRYFKTQRKIFLLTIILNVITLFICGTKACTFGAVIISVIMLAMYLFFCFIKKEMRFNKKVFILSLLVLIGQISILDITPAFSRMKVTSSLSAQYAKEEAAEKEENEDVKEEIINEADAAFKTLPNVKDPGQRKKIIINFFDSCKEHGIQPEFIEEKYPYKHDPEFWASIFINNTKIARQDNRHIEEQMLIRIKEINNKKSDDWFGLTYSRTSKVFNLESDFKYQYYSLGIVGTFILIGPLLLNLILGIILTLKRDFSIENTSICFGIALLYAVAYTSGNMLDNLSILIILGFITGYLMSKLKIKKSPKEAKHNTFSIIMPTYNDSESIIEAIESVRTQTYKEWELLISDDGSTDNTKEVVENYIKENKENRIKYYYHNNQDQLNAILNVLEEASGNYIHILHSDDKLINKHLLKRINEDIMTNPCDVLYSNNLVTMNEKSKITGIIEYPDYVNKDYIMATQLLWLGRQYYCDVAFFKKEVYKTSVKYNYLTWNTPYWLNYNGEPHMLDVRTVDYPLFNYRVFEGNYINNEIGQLNVISGELRTAIHLLKYYDIPKYKLQYFIFRVFNKLGLRDFYRPVYKKQESNKKAEIVKFIINKRYTDEEIEKYPHLNSLIKFFENYKNRTIEIKTIEKNEVIYQGKDMRAFNKLIVNGEVSKLYKEVFKEMEKGFNVIETTKENKEKVENIVKFLNMYPFVEVKTTDNKKIKKKK